MKKKTLVLDIDGTLVNAEKKITKETKKAIIDTQKRGHTVIIATGRPTAGVMQYAKELKLEEYGGYVLSFNGGHVLNMKTGEIIYQKTLPSQMLAQIYHFAVEHDCGIVTYLADEIISGRRIDRYLKMESKMNNMPMRIVENFPAYAEFDLNKCLLTKDEEEAAVLVEMMQKKWGEILSIYRSEPFFIEVMPKGVDKANSLDKMLHSVGLTKEDTICCGDGFNDISMISYAGIGVAMGNAQPQVKEVADFVTGSNEEDGLVAVVDKFME